MNAFADPRRVVTRLFACTKERARVACLLLAHSGITLNNQICEPVVHCARGLPTHCCCGWGGRHRACCRCRGRCGCSCANATVKRVSLVCEGGGVDHGHRTFAIQFRDQVTAQAARYRPLLRAHREGRDDAVQRLCSMFARHSWRGRHPLKRKAGIRSKCVNERLLPNVHDALRYAAERLVAERHQTGQVPHVGRKLFRAQVQHV